MFGIRYGVAFMFGMLTVRVIRYQINLSHTQHFQMLMNCDAKN